jgi:hypothetical protein
VDGNNAQDDEQESNRDWERKAKELDGRHEDDEVFEGSEDRGNVILTPASSIFREEGCQI